MADFVDSSDPKNDADVENIDESVPDEVAAMFALDKKKKKKKPKKVTKRCSYF